MSKTIFSCVPVVAILLLACSLATSAVTPKDAEPRQVWTTVKPAGVEAQIRQHFGYWEDQSSYNASDPANTVAYTETQKQSQRDAAKNMMASLFSSATATTAPHDFTIPAGIYRIEPGQIEIKHAVNFTIYAAGVEIISDSKSSGAVFSFADCANITLTGRARGKKLGADQVDATALIVDSEQLPMSVARILAVDAKIGALDVEILPGYSTNLPNSERILAYDAKGHMLNLEQMRWLSVTPMGAQKFRLAMRAMRNPTSWDAVLVSGHLLAMNLGKYNISVFSSKESKDMTFESIRVYSGGGAPADRDTAGYTVFRDWRLYPRPGTSRLPIATGLGQFSKNGGSFLFEDCEFGPHLDDGINLLSGLSVVGNVLSEKEIVITGHEKPTVGSTLTFYDYNTWKRLGEAKVQASEDVAGDEILSAVNAFSKKNRARENARRAYRTMLDKPVKLTPFAEAVHSNYRADSIVVRGCLIRDQLAQILLLQGAKSGIIESNLLLRSTAAGVSAQFSQYWWEGPMPENLIIRNNVIRDNPVDAAVNGVGATASVAVYAGTLYPTSEHLLHHFSIEGNTIINPSLYGIVVRNADDVVISNNCIINPGACNIVENYNGHPASIEAAAICLAAVSGATVTDNKIVYGNSRCQRAILMETNCAAGAIRLERNHEFHGETGSTENLSN